MVPSSGAGYGRPLNGSGWLAGHVWRQYARRPCAVGWGSGVKQVLLVVIGVAAAVAGIIWTLQGLGYVGGSFMSGVTVWAVIGPVVALAGLVLLVIAGRARRRAR